MKNIHLFLVSLNKVKSNVQGMAIIMFFLMFLSFYLNHIYLGIFCLLFFLMYNLILWVTPNEEWVTSKKIKMKGNINLIKFIFFSFISYIGFRVILFFVLFG